MRQAIQRLNNRHDLILATGMDERTKECIGVDELMLVGEPAFVYPVLLDIDAQQLDARVVNDVIALLNRNMPLHFADVSNAKNSDVSDSKLFAERAHHRYVRSLESQAIASEHFLE